MLESFVRVFVTGATGFVGRHVVAELLARGHEVFAAVRDSSNFSTLLGGVVTTVSVDFTDKVSIRKALEAAAPDAVVHLIGIISESRSKGITFDSVHRKISEDLYAASKELGIKRAIHMSALGVHQDAPSYYHRTKLAAERFLRSSGLAYTIFRPSLIIGPGQKLFSDMRRFAGIVPLIPLPQGGKHMMQPVDVRDVACSFAGALDDETTCNNVYEICGPDVVTFRELLDSIFSSWQNDVFYLSMPKWFMSAAGQIAETIMDNAPLSADLVRMMWKDNICGIYGDAAADAVKKVCGRDPVALADSLRWALSSKSIDN